MSTAKVAVTIQEELVRGIDGIVDRDVSPSRSKAIQQALAEKLARRERRSLIRECKKLGPHFERAMAEEGMALEKNEWPGYRGETSFGPTSSSPCEMSSRDQPDSHVVNKENRQANLPR